MSAKRPKVLSALAILVVVGGLLFWWVNAIPNEDPLWFWRSFKARADWITVYWNGITHMYFPGDSEYEEIMAAFSKSVAHCSGYESSVGLSDENLERLRSEERLLELHYNESVRVHTRHLFPEAKFFWVPLSGTHAAWRRVFSGLLETPRVGVLNVSEGDFATLEAAVRAAAEPNEP
ncbi:MAG: hypothetical protein JXC32_16420 [Anaerolineae bacterium]|nr:hypothetical protein [Anaerolineae bacterium]